MDFETLRALGEHFVLVAMGGLGGYGAHKLHKKSETTADRTSDCDGPGCPPLANIERKLNDVLEGQRDIRIHVSGTRGEVAELAEKTRLLGNRVDGLMEWRQVVESRWQRPMKDL